MDITVVVPLFNEEESLTKHEFTTGAAPSGVAPAKVVSLPKRVAAKKAAKRTAVVPVKRSLQLVK